MGDPTGFALYMTWSAVFGVLFVWLLKPHKRFRNPVVIVCSTCGKKLYRRPPTAMWAWIDGMVWMVVAWLVIFRLPLSTPVMWMLMIVLVFAWNATQRHIVEAYFRWRHPMRCDGGGHFAPQPQGG